MNLCKDIYVCDIINLYEGIIKKWQRAHDLIKNILKKVEEIVIDNRRVDNLYRNIADHIHTARNNVLYTVNTEQVRTYWLIGRDIVEEEQAGKERAQYGAFLLQEISSRLAKEFGDGFSVSTLKHIRKFYLLFKNHSQLRTQCVANA